jgi:preprotein translocase subunit SecF
MFDNIYSNLTRKVPYKSLIFIPIIASVLMLVFIAYNGMPLGIDFKGGTLIELTTDNAVDSSEVSALTKDLQELNLEDLKVYSGKDLESGKNKITVSTSSVIGPNNVSSVLKKYFGEMRESDIASVVLKSRPPSDLDVRLKSRLKQTVDVKYDEETKTLTIIALDMNKEDLDSALTFYLEEDVSVDLQKKNFNINAMQPTLGEKLRNDGMKAALVGYILMAVVILLAFRDIVPSIAVLLSATCDGVITLGLMSLFGIVLEPASLVALIMLVGYSVDTDILLTTRMLKRRRGELNEAVDGAIKTGLTMTGTTFVVMVVVLLVSTFFTHLSALTSIASVLLLGLLADVTSTWFMNAGILKWYIEEKGGKIKKAYKPKKGSSVD